MKPLLEMKNHKQRFIRSFLLAVLLIAVGAALGFCQSIEIKGEVHRNDAPAELIKPIITINPSLDVPSESIFLTPANDAQVPNSNLTKINSTIESDVRPETEFKVSKSYVSTNDRKTSRPTSFRSVLDQNKTNGNSTTSRVANQSAEKEGWKSFYNDAVRESINSKRPIMLLFTGSDWCPTCRRLDIEILRTKTFTDWSRETVIKVELNFPRSYRLPLELAQQNQQLRNRYASYLTTGFPAALFINSDGKVLGKARYTPAGVDAWLQQADVALASIERASEAPKKETDVTRTYGHSIFN